MTNYSWDTGTYIGHIIFNNSISSDIMNTIDSSAPHCDSFFRTRASNGTHYLCSTAMSEIRHRRTLMETTIQALIMKIKTGKFSPSPNIDVGRLMNLSTTLSSFSKEDVVLALASINGDITAREINLKTVCNFQKVAQRLSVQDEQLLKPHFEKPGDLCIFSATIIIHNQMCECNLITTDKHFKNIESKLDCFPHKIPTIEFVWAY